MTGEWYNSVCMCEYVCECERQGEKEREFSLKASHEKLANC